MDEHGEINILIFNGLTAHDGDNQVVPGLAKAGTLMMQQIPTFHMAEDAKWQDGEPVTADDVKFYDRSYHGSRKMVLRMHQTTKSGRRDQRG